MPLPPFKEQVYILNMGVVVQEYVLVIIQPSAMAPAVGFGVV